MHKKNNEKNCIKKKHIKLTKQKIHNLHEEKNIYKKRGKHTRRGKKRGIKLASIADRGKQKRQ